MQRDLLILTSDREPELAESLLDPLTDAGYNVHCALNEPIRKLFSEHVSRLLEEDIPVVLCATQRAVGNKSVRRHISDLHRSSKARLFILQLEDEADVEDFAPASIIEHFGLSHDLAVRSLVESLKSIYPVTKHDAPSTFALEKRYRDILLEIHDIVSVASLPADHEIARRQHELRLNRLYIPLRVQAEAQPSRFLSEPSFDSSLEYHPQSDEPRPADTISGSKKAETQSRGNNAQFERRPIADIPSKDQRHTIGECLADSKRSVILGHPGSGKTTLARWMITALLLRAKKDGSSVNFPDIAALPTAELLPIVLLCRDLTSISQTYSLEDFLSSWLRRLGFHDDERAALGHHLIGRLENGSAILILDGLDEILDRGKRVQFCEYIESLAIRFAQSPMVVTSRVVGYREAGYKLGRGFEHFVLADLTRLEKDDFIYRWCGLTETTDRRETAAKELIQDIHSSERIERLTDNPMLLTTIALVKRSIGRLPSHRAQLYSDALRVLMQWRSSLHSRPITDDEALPQLRYLAFEMCDRGAQRLRRSQIIDILSKMRGSYPNLPQTCTPYEFLEYLEARTGILLEAGRIPHRGTEEAVYEFRHLTFQEFLAACALIWRHYPDYNPGVDLAAKVRQLVNRMTASWDEKDETNEEPGVQNWREAIRLCVALADMDASSVLRAVLTSTLSESRGTARARAVLALLCLSEVHGFTNGWPVANEIIDVFIEHLRINDGTGRTDADAALMEIAGTKWAALLRKKLIVNFDRTLNLATGGVIGLLVTTELARSGKDLSEWLTQQIQILNLEDDYAVIEFALCVMMLSFQGKLTVTSGVAEVLIPSVTKKPSRAIASAWALGWLGPRLLEKTNNHWRPTDSEKCTFVDIVSDSESHPTLVAFLAKILGPERVDAAALPLLQWLSTSDEFLRCSLVHALGEIKNEKTKEKITSCLNDGNSRVRAEAAWALGSMKSKDAARNLIAALRDKDATVRLQAAWSLGEIGSKVAGAPLLKCVNDPADGVRSQVAASLGALIIKASEGKLIQLLKDASPLVRTNATWALGRIESKLAAAALIACLDDMDIDVRSQAAISLGQTMGLAAESKLIRSLADGEAAVRANSAWALGRLGSQQANHALIQCLGDVDGRVRAQAAWSLGVLGCNNAETHLTKCLIDPDPYVRRLAVFALGRMRSTLAQANLIERLEDSDSLVRSQAVSALGYMRATAGIAGIFNRFHDVEQTVRDEANKCLSVVPTPAFEEDEKWLGSVLSADPMYAPAHHSLGVILRGQKRYKEAEVHLKRAAELSPDDRIYIKAVANLFMEQRQYAEAKNWYEKALALDSGMKSAQSSLELILAKLSGKPITLEGEQPHPSLGAFALHEAVLERSETLAIALIESGADVNGRNESGLAPLHVAAMQGTASISEILLKSPGVQVNAHAGDGRTPLHIAAYHGSLAVCNLLLSSKSAILDAKTIDGHTPLHMAAIRGHEEICRRLLASHADAGACSNTGRTALHFAAQGNFAQVCRFLIEDYSFKRDNETRAGKTPLQLAIDSESQETIIFLTGYSADTSSQPASA